MDKEHMSLSSLSSYEHRKTHCLLEKRKLGPAVLKVFIAVFIALKNRPSENKCPSSRPDGGMDLSLIRVVSSKVGSRQATARFDSQEMGMVVEIARRTAVIRDRITRPLMPNMSASDGKLRRKKALKGIRVITAEKQ